MGACTIYNCVSHGMKYETPTSSYAVLSVTHENKAQPTNFGVEPLFGISTNQNLDFTNQDGNIFWNKHNQCNGSPSAQLYPFHSFSGSKRQP